MSDSSFLPSVDTSQFDSVHVTSTDEFVIWRGDCIMPEALIIYQYHKKETEIEADLDFAKKYLTSHAHKVSNVDVFG